jgi:hypothetical protein
MPTSDDTALCLAGNTLMKENCIERWCHVDPNLVPVWEQSVCKSASLAVLGKMGSELREKVRSGAFQDACEMFCDRAELSEALIGGALSFVSGESGLGFVAEELVEGSVTSMIETASTCEGVCLESLKKETFENGVSDALLAEVFCETLVGGGSARKYGTSWLTSPPKSVRGDECLTTKWDPHGPSSDGNTLFSHVKYLLGNSVDPRDISKRRAQVQMEAYKNYGAKNEDVRACTDLELLYRLSQAAGADSRTAAAAYAASIRDLNKDLQSFAPGVRG